MIRKRFWLEELIYVNDCFIRKRDFSKIPTLKSEHETFDFRGNEIKTFHDGQPQVFEIGHILQVLKTLEGKWLPLPVFKNNAINQDFFGPIDWVRVYIKSINNQEIEKANCCKRKM